MRKDEPATALIKWDTLLKGNSNYFRLSQGLLIEKSRAICSLLMNNQDRINCWARFLNCFRAKIKALSRRMEITNFLSPVWPLLWLFSFCQFSELQAFRIARKWVVGNYKVFNSTGHMWEKVFCMIFCYLHSYDWTKLWVSSSLACMHRAQFLSPPIKCTCTCQTQPALILAVPLSSVAMIEKKNQKTASFFGRSVECG